MDDMPNLKKFMKKNKMDGDDPQTDPTTPKAIKPAPAWEPSEVEGHDDISTDDFETEDTLADPLDDETGPDSKKAMSNLDKFEKMYKKQ